MRHFATTFDKSYAAKGICLYESLKRYSTEDFTLHVLALDNETAWLLAELALPNVEILPHNVFEKAMHLEHIKMSRAWNEWCWTVASQLMEYLMPWVGDVTYVDSDVMWFANPEVVFQEIGDRSIGIVPHRFNDIDRQRLGKNGEYNVGIIYARNSEAGRQCIGQWAKNCRDWCYARNEGGKFADQAYLDSWETDYPGEVAVIRNLGVNLGPWSIGNFSITNRGESVFVNDDELVAFHYHEYLHGQRLTNYKLRECDIELIYKPYAVANAEANDQITIAEEMIKARRGQQSLQAQRA